MSRVKKCQICGKPATMFLTQIVNGQVTELAFCEECARAKGLFDPQALTFAEKSYEEIYEILEPHWSGTQIWNTGAQYAEDGAAALPEAAAEESMEAPAADGASKEFGQTNVQTEGVDEADTIKNDGRYLYQLAEYPAGEGEKETGAARWGIQIVDTKGGLREASFVGRFEYPREFYVWEDLLIVLDDGYYTSDYVKVADASV